LLDHILEGIKNCPVQPDSFAVDSWAVDYGYIDRDGRLLGDTIAYRDPRTDSVVARVLRDLPDLYLRTGIQIMPFNTIFQAIEDLESRPDIVGRAARLLLLPDLINHMLTGVAFNEYTVCSSTALLDMRTNRWDTAIMDRYGLRRDLFADVTMPGRIAGILADAFVKKTGKRFPVCLSAGHDTAAAIAGIPVSTGRNWGYISSGTWSLVGVERRAPIINAASAKRQITNEGGVGGTIRFLRNVPGMWLLEECLRNWKAKSVSCDYDAIVQSARESRPFRSLLDPADARFQAPESMAEAITDFCRETGQPVPETVGQVARCIFESLALRYREVFEEIAEVTGEPVEEIHIVGGASRNDLLNQMTADACGKIVIRGPAEATVMGNVAVQAIALGLFKNLADYRERQIRVGAAIEYLPRQDASLQEAYGRFKELPRG
jgi:rhamnulokinase